MIIQKGLGYFDHSLLKGDIVKTNFGAWVAIKKVIEHGGESFSYKYLIISDYSHIPKDTCYPNELYNYDIIVAFESARIKDIRKDYPEYFI